MQSNKSMIANDTMTINNEPWTMAPWTMAPSIYPLTINNSKGETLVILNMETGHVELFGDPNEAAIIFWNSVSQNCPNVK